MSTQDVSFQPQGCEKVKEEAQPVAIRLARWPLAAGRRLACGDWTLVARPALAPGRSNRPKAIESADQNRHSRTDLAKPA
jgi:hypothetical protein